jgi:hypothetical protein
MNGALPFLAVGLVLIVLLILLLLRERARDQDRFDCSEGDTTRAALRREALQQLTDRLFGSEDWHFIVKQGSPRLRRLFLQQRTDLALSWLRSVRVDARRLMRIHRARVRTSPRLEPQVELIVAVDYLLFELLCQVIALVIRLRGPVAMGRLVGCADGLSARLYEVITRILPAELAYGNSKGSPASPVQREREGDSS